MGAPIFDTSKAIAEQGAANQKAALQTATINRPNVSSPFGEMTWTQGGSGYNAKGFDDAWGLWNSGGQQGAAPTKEQFGFDPMQWSATTTIDPGSQAALNGTWGGINMGQNNVDTNAVWRATQNRYNDMSPQVQDAAATAAKGNDMMDRAMGALTYGAPSYDKAAPLPTADNATRQRVEDAMYQRATARLDPRWANAEDQLSTRLANQGITLGSKAYDTEQNLFSQGRNDAYSSAMNDAINYGGSEMQRLFDMGMSARKQSVDEINYQDMAPWMKGQIASGMNSQMGANAQGWQGLQTQQELAKDTSARNLFDALTQNQDRSFGTNMAIRDQILGETANLQDAASNNNVAAVEADPVFAAMQEAYGGQMGKYNQQQASKNSNKQALAGLAGAAMLAFSDERLKEDIQPIGERNGIRFYSWTWNKIANAIGLFGTASGVLAQEIAKQHPDAVVAIGSYLAVDYSRIMELI